MDDISKQGANMTTNDEGHLDDQSHRSFMSGNRLKSEGKSQRKTRHPLVGG
jgi:hypothetical protein